MTTDPYGGGEKTYAQSGVEWIAGQNTVATDIWQFPTFPDMTDDGNEAVGKLITGIGEHCEKQIPILMFTPTCKPFGTAAEQDEYVNVLAKGLLWAKGNGFNTVSATLLEDWMNGSAIMSDDDMPAAHKQVAGLVKRAVKKATDTGPIPDFMDVEYLRPGWVDGIVGGTMAPGEFSRYVTLRRMVDGLLVVNDEIGDLAPTSRPWARGLHDFAHAGDSGFTLEQIGEQLRRMVAADIVGITHASVPTTRGCLTSAMEWIFACLKQAAELGALHTIIAEVFYWADALLEPLRAPEIGFGADTSKGRSVDQVFMDSLEMLVRLLNMLVDMEILDPAASATE